MSNFLLSFQGFGHSSDVRDVSAWGDRVVSASRDRSIIVWKKSADSKSYSVELTLTGHTGFVNSVCATSSFESGFLVSASQDKTAVVWGPDGTKGVVMQGHTEAVCCVRLSADCGLVLTGSWDKSARVWDRVSGDCMLHLTGHEASVWAIEMTPNGSFVTASADQKIRMFSRTGEATNMISAHSDACRSLAVVPPANPTVLASSGNDGMVKLWAVETLDAIQSVDEHEGFPVYGIRSGGSLLLSASEDKNVKILDASGGALQLKQSLLHPCVVWNAALLSNGDVATAGADGVMRIFSSDSQRVADDGEIQAYDLKIASQTVSSQMVGQIDSTKLGGPDALLTPGVKPDQRKIINNNGKVEIYQWIATESRWTKIGDVVDTEKAQPKMLDGKQYDFVFDVDVQEGAPPLKLGYNKGQDPWIAAQEFLWKYELDQTFLEQVADFIVKNAGQANTMPSAAAGAADPFTGGSRYVPRAAPSSSPALATDPFTGGSSYRSGMTPGNAAPPKRTSFFFPKKEMVVFTTGNFPAMTAKLLEFNQDPSVAQVTTTTLESLASTAALGPTAGFLSPDQSACAATVLQWPAEKILPVLDMYRMLVCHPSAEFATDAVLATMLAYATATHAPNVRMLAMRYVCNCFASQHAVGLVLKNSKEILAAVQGAHEVESKNVRTAYLNLLFNYSVALAGTPTAPLDIKAAVIQHLAACLSTETDPLLLLLALSAVGTLAHSDPVLKDALTAEQGLRTRLTELAKTAQGDALKCCSDLTAFLYA